MANCSSLKDIEIYRVETYEYDGDNNVIGYAELRRLYMDNINGSVFAGTSIERFYSSCNNMSLGGRAFAESKIKTVVINATGYTLTVDSMSNGPFTDAHELEEVWLTGGANNIWISDAVFAKLDHDVNFYFPNLTRQDIIDKMGGAGETWFNTASKYAHFYFKDTMPTDVVWPEEIKPAT